MNHDSVRPSAGDVLDAVAGRVQAEYDAHNRRMSFERWLEKAAERPAPYLRDAARYVVDMIDSFGRKSPDPLGGPTGFHVFEQGDPGERVVGQHHTQEELYRLLKGFAQAGRVTKLVVLHGPNGSAKSSLVAALIRGLERYSRTDDGALYTFHWVFPEEKLADGARNLGFSKGAEPGRATVDSYASLPEEQVAVRIIDEQRDSPWLLLPPAMRLEYIRSLSPESVAAGLPHYLLKGDLSGKSKAIFEALLAAYKGDLKKVLRHVSVERWFVSRRYKRGAVVLEPEMSVDASIRQITMDRRLQNMPSALQSLSLYEPSGRLIEANHGVIEYSDLLKRPPETYKYLLATTEKGTVDLDAALVHLDLVMLGTTNDLYLDSFKQAPDFPSFRGRMEFVKAPYLNNYKLETEIYRNQLRLDGAEKLPAPFVVEAAALWAVLTRLKPPDPEHFPERAHEVVRKLNPLDKALIFAGEMPDWLTETQKTIIAAVREQMAVEYHGRDDYEGAVGVSPREVKTILLTAAQSEKHGAFVPMCVFDEIERVVANPSMYTFLRQRSVGPFFHQAKLLEYVRDWYLGRVDRQVKQALNLVDEGRYDEFFVRYTQQLAAWRKKEKVFNTMTRKWEPIDTRFLEEVERKMGVAEREAEGFRGTLLNRIASWSLDNPGKEIDIRFIFERQIQQLERDVSEQQKRTVARVTGHAHGLLARPDATTLGDEERTEAQSLIAAMLERFGYTEPALRAVLGYLVRHRY